MISKNEKLKKKSTGSLSNVAQEYGELSISESERKLIKLIRSIGFGEIETIEIRNGQAVSYKMAWKSGKLV